MATHFSRLLRHAWVTVGLFLFPGHHTGGIITNLNNLYLVKNINIPCCVILTYVYLYPLYVDWLGYKGSLNTTFAEFGVRYFSI
jgi:hypothetical protein